MLIAVDKLRLVHHNQTLAAVGCDIIMKPHSILIRDYTYNLPNEKIATQPLPERDASKLLVYKNGGIISNRFHQLSNYLPNDSLLILNNTKVIEARLLFQKESGGVVEIFCLEPYGQAMETALQQTGSIQWKCLVGGASKWKHGQVLSKTICVNDKTVTVNACYKTKLDDGFVVEFSWAPAVPFVTILHAAGAIPLPPYIKRKTVEEDSERYQTIFGKVEGSVAAPTAALHFTEDVFERLEHKNVGTAFITLNVGAGTFKPVKSATIAEHSMHGEDFVITRGVIKKIVTSEKIIAVGTTSLRTLESVHWLGVKLIKGPTKDEWIIEQWEVYDLDDSISYKQSLNAIIDWMDDNKITELHCRTSLLIVPGYTFKIPAGLITNFHQPQSTLLLLVAAFIGSDWQKVYQYALENDFRFLSYGDSSLLWKNETAGSENK